MKKILLLFATALLCSSVFCQLDNDSLLLGFKKDGGKSIVPIYKQLADGCGPSDSLIQDSSEKYIVVGYSECPTYKWLKVLVDNSERYVASSYFTIGDYFISYLKRREKTDYQLSSLRQMATSYVAKIKVSPSSNTWTPYQSSPSTSASSGGDIHVNGYYRKNGTYVQPYTRSAPRKH